MQAKRNSGMRVNGTPQTITELDVEAFNDCFKVDAVPITFIGNGRSMRGGAPGAHAPIDREGADRLCDVFSTSRRRWWPVLPPGAFYVQSQGLQGSEPNIMQQQQGQEDVSIQTHYWQRHGPHALAGLMSQPVIAGELAGKWATEKQTQLSTFVKLYWDRTAQVPGTDYVVIFDVQQGGMVRPAAQRVHMQSAATCRPSGNLYLDGTTAVASGAKHRKATAQASGAAQLQPDQPVFDFMGWGDGFSIGITDTMQSPKIQPHSLLEGLACGCSALDPDCHIPEPMSMRAAGGTGYSQWSKSRSMMVEALQSTSEGGDGASPRGYSQYPFYGLSPDRETFMVPKYRQQQGSTANNGEGATEEERDEEGHASSCQASSSPCQLPTVKVPCGVWFYTTAPSGDIQEALEVPWDHPFHTAPVASLTSSAVDTAREYFSLQPAAASSQLPPIQPSPAKPSTKKQQQAQQAADAFTPSPIVLEKLAVTDVVVAYQEALDKAGVERGGMFGGTLGVPAISSGLSWARRLHHLRQAASLEYMGITARCRLLDQLMALPDARMHCPEVGSVLWQVVSNVKTLADQLQLADTDGFRAVVRPNDCIMVTRCLDLLPVSSWALNPGQSNEADLKTVWRELVGQYGLHKKMAASASRGAGLWGGAPPGSEAPAAPKKSAKAAAAASSDGKDGTQSTKPKAPKAKTAAPVKEKEEVLDQGSEPAQAIPNSTPTTSETTDDADGSTASTPSRKPKAAKPGARRAKGAAAEDGPTAAGGMEPGAVAVAQPVAPPTEQPASPTPKRKHMVAERDSGQESGGSQGAQRPPRDEAPKPPPLPPVAAPKAAAPAADVDEEEQTPPSPPVPAPAQSPRPFPPRAPTLADLAMRASPGASGGGAAPNAEEEEEDDEDDDNAPASAAAPASTEITFDSTSPTVAPSGGSEKGLMTPVPPAGSTASAPAMARQAGLMRGSSAAVSPSKDLFRQPLRLQSARPQVPPVHVASPSGDPSRNGLGSQAASFTSTQGAVGQSGAALRPLPAPGAPDLAGLSSAETPAAETEAPKVLTAKTSITETALAALLDAVLVKHRFKQQCEEAKALANGASGIQGALSWFEMRVNRLGDDKGPTGVQPSMYYKKLLQSRNLPAGSNTTQNARQIARAIFDEWFGAS